MPLQLVPKGTHKRDRTPREPQLSEALPTVVYLVVTPGVLLLDLAGIAEPLRLANKFAQLQGEAHAPFHLHMCSPSGHAVRSSLPLMLDGLQLFAFDARRFAAPAHSLAGQCMGGAERHGGSTGCASERCQRQPQGCHRLVARHGCARA
jgi:hypothetical protein